MLQCTVDCSEYAAARRDLLDDAAKGSARHLPQAPSHSQSQELAQFIDENAAFLVQKGIYEYSRARAGHYAKILFREPEFAEAVERSRWAAFPLGLAMVAEVVEGILRPRSSRANRPVNWRRSPP